MGVPRGLTRSGGRRSTGRWGCCCGWWRRRRRSVRGGRWRRSRWGCGVERGCRRVQTRRYSHAYHSHTVATRVGLPRAIAGSCTGGRVLCGRGLRGRVIGARHGHEHCLRYGRGEQADGLRGGSTLGEDGTREELECRSEVEESVRINRGCGQHQKHKDSRIRIGGRRSVASGTVRR